MVSAPSHAAAVFVTNTATSPTILLLVARLAQLFPNRLHATPVPAPLTAS